MKKRTERVLLCLFVLLCGTKASAQWTVFDPSNLVHHQLDQRDGRDLLYGGHDA